MNYWYDYKLVVLSVVVAVLAAQLALAIAARIKQHKTRTFSWLLGGGAAMGIGIWAMHFIGMLAYHLPIPLGYDIPLTLLSLLLAIVASGFALYIVYNSDVLSWRDSVNSALLLGGGIAAMHYTGIYALKLSPSITFEPLLFLLSLLIAFSASLAALRFAFNSARSGTLFDSNKTIAALIMGGAIAGMHYTGMASMRIAPDALCLAAQQGLDPGLLAMAVVVLVMVVLVITMVVLSSDLHLTSQEKEFALRLADENKQLLAKAKQLAVDLSAQHMRSEQFTHELFDTIGTVVAVLDKSGNVVRFNKAAEQVSGFSRDEVIGQPLWNRLIPEEQREEVRGVFSELVSGHFPNHHTGHWLTRDGERRLIEWTNTALKGGDGCVEYVIAAGTDVTEKRSTEEELKIAAVAFNTNEAIVVTDPAARILRANRMFTEITGYEEEEVIGKTTSLLKSGRHDEAFYREMWSRLGEQGHWMGEVWNRRKNGEVYPEWLRISAVYDEAGQVINYVASFSDISMLKETQEELSYISNYDPSTGLPNHNLFSELLHKELLMSPKSGNRGLLFAISLPRLRMLNDTLGARTVDRFIKQFVGLLQDYCGEQALYARFSGRSFMVAIPGVEAESELSTRACQVAEALIGAVSAGLRVNDIEVHTEINIGINTFPQQDLRAEDITQNALTALARAEAQEGNQYQFFSEELHHAAAESYGMELALRRALVNDELQLYLQPQVDPQGQILGAEALLRWQRDGQFVSPAKFVPLAEKGDLIGPLSDFVFRKGVELIASLVQHGIGEGFDCIALNLSARQFQDPTFIERLKDYLIAAAVPPELLKIELTETALINDPEEAVATIRAFKELGIRIALDDFGTGYSSLSYLHRIPIDQLKIDQSFVRDMTINKTSRAITETIISMARSMNIEVIAEGVETREEQQMLESFGCLKYQGYFFARPMPFEEFLARLN